MIEVTDQEFHEKVLKKSLRMTVVVDFWAPWCSPCKILEPLLEKLEKEYKNRFVLVKINVDENKETAKMFGVTSIPSIKMIKDGRIIAEFAGSLPEEIVREWLDRNL
ncbi:MAG: thioredoxin [Candidatus Aenigmarchaeota archaeon]|nr:thioredoxin [Candidatus Aenigmarchaeota archaeon]